MVTLMNFEKPCLSYFSPNRSADDSWLTVMLFALAGIFGAMDGMVADESWLALMLFLLASISGAMNGMASESTISSLRIFELVLQLKSRINSLILSLKRTNLADNTCIWLFILIIFSPSVSVSCLVKSVSKRKFSISLTMLAMFSSVWLTESNFVALLFTEMRDTNASVSCETMFSVVSLFLSIRLNAA